MTPRVSVIMPVYETVAWLDEALDSVQAQTLDDWEVIVVDDGSRTPEARRVLDAIQRPKVRLLRLPHGGVCRARNRAIAEARGRYLSFLDGDDRMRPRFLEVACARLDADEDIAFVTTWVRLFGDVERDWMPERCDLPALLGDCSVATAAVVRADLVRAVGGFDETMELGHEDWDLWLSVLGRGQRGELVREVLFEYRQRAGSRSTVADRGATYLGLFGQRVRKHEAAYRAHLFDFLWDKEVAIGHLLYDLLDTTARLDARTREVAAERRGQRQALADARAGLVEIERRLEEIEGFAPATLLARARAFLRGRR